MGNCVSAFFKMAFKQEIVFKDLGFKKFNFKKYKHFGFKKQQVEQKYTLETTKAMMSKTLHAYLNPENPKVALANMEAILAAHEAYLSEKH